MLQCKIILTLSHLVNNSRAPKKKENENDIHLPFQSQKIITSLMENVDPEDLAPSPGSTSTFSTMPKISIPPSAFKTEETVPEYKENQIKGLLTELLCY